MHLPEERTDESYPKYRRDSQHERSRVSQKKLREEMGFAGFVGESSVVKSAIARARRYAEETAAVQL